MIAPTAVNPLYGLIDSAGSCAELVNRRHKMALRRSIPVAGAVDSDLLPLLADAALAAKLVST